MDLKFLTYDDKTNEPSDTTKRAWISFLFILIIGLILLIAMVFTKLNEQVISFFEFLAGLLGISTQGAYTIKRMTEKRKDETITQEEIKKEKQEDFVYIYNSQRDNKNNPSSSCNVTSLQILLQKYVTIADDELWELCNSLEMKKWALANVGQWVKSYINTNSLNQIHAVLAKVANNVTNRKIASCFSGYSMDKIKKTLDEGKTLLIGGMFTKGGHIVAVIGHNDTGLIVMDPWGDWNTNYKERNGDKVLYSYKSLEKIVTGNVIVIG